MTVQTVVAGVIEKNGKVFVAQRSTGIYAGKWEFPGGKTRPGENHREALVREIAEEFGACIEVRDYLHEVPFQIGCKDYCLVAYLARHVSGVFVPEEHSTFAWVLPDELQSIDLAPADIEIVCRQRNLDT